MYWVTFPNAYGPLFRAVCPLQLLPTVHNVSVPYLSVVSSSVKVVWPAGQPSDGLPVAMDGVGKGVGAGDIVGEHMSSTNEWTRLEYDVNESKPTKALS